MINNKLTDGEEISYNFNNKQGLKFSVFFKFKDIYKQKPINFDVACIYKFY